MANVFALRSLPTLLCMSWFRQWLQLMFVLRIANSINVFEPRGEAQIASRKYTSRFLIRPMSSTRLRDWRFFRRSLYCWGGEKGSGGPDYKLLPIRASEMLRALHCGAVYHALNFRTRRKHQSIPASFSESPNQISSLIKMYTKMEYRFW